MSSGPAGRPMIFRSVEQLVAHWEDLARRVAIKVGRARVHALVLAIGETQTARDLSRRASEEKVRSLLGELQVAAEEVRARVVNLRHRAPGQRP